MRLLVTGASGMLGSNLLKCLDGDFEVIGTYHSPEGGNFLDIADRDSVIAKVSETGPDAIVHCAALTSVDYCETNREKAYEVNVRGTANLAEAAGKMNAKMVYVSTDFVFDGKKGNYSEKDHPNPVNYYGRTKLEGEEAVASAATDHLILRTCLVGLPAARKTGLLSWMIAKLEKREELTLFEDHHSTPIDVASFGECVKKSLQQDLRGTFHAGGSRKMSNFEMGQMVADVLGFDRGLIKPVRMGDMGLAAPRPKDTSLDSTLLREKLGLEDSPLEDYLKRIKGGCA